MLNTLSVAEIMSIHEVLAADFEKADDPISPAGIKSEHLLESAISRQDTGFNGQRKYNTPIANAASLTYGICLNHPFHNGNKRTALVSLLCHLDKNDLTIDESISHEELYDFMIKVAGHGFAERTSRTRADVSDLEIEQMTKWIRKRTRRVENGERLITFRELKTILQAHDYRLEDLNNNSVDVVKYEEEKIWLGLRTQTKRVRVMRMSYPGDGKTVGRGLLRDLRKRCGLSEVEGVDSKMFYAKSRPADYFVATYRRTLRRLAKT